MPFSVSEFGGLAVAWHESDVRQIEGELKKLDPDLFIDREYEPNGPHGGYVFTCVKQWVGMGHPPVAVLEWRDPSGPRPLSMAIVEQVKRREGRVKDAVAEALAANDRKRQRMLDDVGDAAAEAARDARKIWGTHGAVLPRSQSLRRARDRARGRGEIR